MDNIYINIKYNILIILLLYLNFSANIIRYIYIELELIIQY